MPSTADENAAPHFPPPERVHRYGRRHGPHDEHQDFYHRALTSLGAYQGDARAYQAVGASAGGASALGALAIGALATGAVAVGALAIGRLVVGQAHLRHLRIDELEIGRIRFIDPNEDT